MNKRADATVERFRKREKKERIERKLIASYLNGLGRSTLTSLFGFAIGVALRGERRRASYRKSGPGRRHIGKVNSAGTKLSRSLEGKHGNYGSVYGRVNVVSHAFRTIEANNNLARMAQRKIEPRIG